VTISPVEIFNILLAVLAGGLIGLERELHQKAAGFRTITLICVGASVITMLDTRLAASGRVTANIVTGIGFLGAGVILHDVNRVKGLTTAATVWLAAGLGIGIGSGAYLLALITTAVVLLVMDTFARLEHRIDGLWDMRHYQIVLACNPAKVEELEKRLRLSGLRVGLRQEMKISGQLVCAWDVSGTTLKQNAFVMAIINDPEVIEVKW
jgi:putative Mg2+ transporter-C (MgtC) family protein